MKAHIYQYTVAWCGHFLISEVTSHFHGTMCNIFFEIHRMSPQSDGCSGQERFFSNHLSMHLKNENNLCVSDFIKSDAIPICKSWIYNTIYVFMVYIFILHVLSIFFFDSNQLMNNSIIYLMFQLNSYNFLEQLHVFLKLV